MGGAALTSSALMRVSRFAGVAIASKGSCRINRARGRSTRRIAVDVSTGAPIHLFNSAPVLQVKTPASASALYYVDPVAGPVAIPSSYNVSTGILTAPSLLDWLQARLAEK